MNEGYKPIKIIRREDISNPVAEKQETRPELPEISLQHELREKGGEYIPSGSWWYWNMVDGKPIDDKTKAEMLLAQKEELPYMVSAVLERACNLSCNHCLYQDEKSSREASIKGRLSEVIEHMVSNMPKASEDTGGKRNPEPEFLSGGRILRPWHLDLFKNLRDVRPDVKIGMIDNGTFTKLLAKWPEGLKMDWIDISIDGTEEHHNEQRGSTNAYSEAIHGLMRAREIIRPRSEGGYVASLMTLTNINAGDVPKVADVLFEESGGEPLADKLNLTTMGPTNAVNTELEMRVQDLAQAWDGIKKASAKYNTPTNQRVSLRLYRIEDLEKLATIVGEKKFLESFPDNEQEARERVSFRGNFIETNIDGILVSYLPVSIWPPEELLIEADGAYRVAYEGQFTLDELRDGKSKDGRNTGSYTVAQLTPETDFREVYEKAVDHYWQYFGHKKLDNEFATFQRIREKASK